LYDTTAPRRAISEYFGPTALGAPAATRREHFTHSVHDAAEAHAPAASHEAVAAGGAA
jgi:hypothetical protein